MNPRTTTIYDKFYRQEFIWVHVKSSKAFSNYLRSKISNYDQVVEQDDDCTETDGETLGLVIDGREVIFFWFNKTDPTAIVHELAHAVFTCMRSRGVVLTQESEESFCYALSFLTGEVIKDKTIKKFLTKKQ